MNQEFARFVHLAGIIEAKRLMLRNVRRHILTAPCLIHFRMGERFKITQFTEMTRIRNWLNLCPIKEVG